ncbi:sensor histidine kinase [Pseudonocardia sp. GCM10023141]|uniref:sensor histidine kinase n=1 Tax=Pseudonocardia sp. GCM10023141 TaxID=3252653 RepID=UPI003619DDC8
MTVPAEERPAHPFRGVTLWHLFWLSVLLYQPVFDGNAPLLQWVGLVVIVALFLPIYLLAQVRPAVRRRAPLLITVLAVLSMLINAGAAILLVFAAAFVGELESRRNTLRWLALYSVLIAGFGLWSLQQSSLWALLSYIPCLVLVWALGMITFEHSEQDRVDRMHNAQVEHLATLSERERIARDLHDLLGQTLTGIVVRSQLAQRLARVDVEAGIGEMALVEQAARAALTEVRATVSGWRQVDLDEEITVASDALAAAGVQIAVQRDPDLVLTPMAETALGLALREGVTNVVRHAHASRCTLTLRRVGDDVVLEVTDDGVGGGTGEGNGLRGMRERIGALGGDVQRLATAGTALTVAVPATVAT